MHVCLVAYSLRRISDDRWGEHQLSQLFSTTDISLIELLSDFGQRSFSPKNYMIKHDVVVG